MDYDRSRRKSQIIAKRMVEKVSRERKPNGLPDRQLFHHIREVLIDTVDARIHLGHVDRAAQAQMALIALEELELRGTQLQLFEMK